MDIDVNKIRKIASIEAGRRYLEEQSGPPKVAAVDRVLLVRAGTADMELMKIACDLRPDDPTSAYEDLGGTYSQTVKE